MRFCVVELDQAGYLAKVILIITIGCLRKLKHGLKIKYTHFKFKKFQFFFMYMFSILLQGLHSMLL